ncbi:MAG: hypothetical protein MR357_01245 [Anaeroplasma sp.]|nr:hypothetical protein [Anaeroplasma sp.]
MLSEQNKAKSRVNLHNAIGQYPYKAVCSIKYFDEKNDMYEVDDIDVVITDSVKARVNIYWENKIENYRDKGLFGYYDADYCFMDMDPTNTYLTIEATNEFLVYIKLESNEY